MFHCQNLLCDKLPEHWPKALGNLIWSVICWFGFVVFGVCCFSGGSKRTCVWWGWRCRTRACDAAWRLARLEAELRRRAAVRPPPGSTRGLPAPLGSWICRRRGRRPCWRAPPAAAPRFPPSRLHVQGLAARSRPLTSAPCLPLRPATFTYIKEIRALKKYANPARRGARAFLARSPFIEAFN